MERFLTVPQMTECEQRSDKSGVSLASLMDNAAQGLFRETIKAAHRLSQDRHTSITNILIIAGKGNNGGDGLVCAGLLKEAGFNVLVYLSQGQPATELSKAAYRRLDRELLTDDITSALESCEILIDCIFGTGFKGNIREDAVPLFEKINKSPAYRIACDIPSGCDADSGLCDIHAVSADMTVTFHRKKVGMAFTPTREKCGGIIVCDIGITAECEQDGFEVIKPDESEIISLLPHRPVYGHKGTFGRLMCICASERYIGAGQLSVTAAMRTGVGLTTLIAPEKVVGIIAGSTPECTYLPLKASTHGTLRADDTGVILESITKADAVLIGCGLAVNDDTRQIVREVIQNAACPLVIDADGLNCIAGDTDILKQAKAPVILTPHTGELARLSGKDLGVTAKDRLGLSRELAKRTGAMVVAKSAGTLIVSTDRAVISTYGNTALSKGGSGDMLAGMTASFLAQGVSPEGSAELGCYVLGRSAEIAAQELGERSVIARDILSFIPGVLRNL